MKEPTIFCDMDGNPTTWENAMVLLGTERRVSLTLLWGGMVAISTVFLSINHRVGPGKPLIYETMAFCVGRSETQVRYSTIRAARAGHAAIVTMWHDPARFVLALVAAWWDRRQQ